ncbi:hypothetical protein AAMO2058_001446900 [Amorphochlora amoebiformis]
MRSTPSVGHGGRARTRRDPGITRRRIERPGGGVRRGREKDSTLETKSNGEIKEATDFCSPDKTLNPPAEKIRKKKKNVKKSPQRPSLILQLRAIGAKTADISNDIRKRAGLETKEIPVLNVSCRDLIVGKATSRYPSIVSFYNDRCTYLFYHPFQSKEISMEMYYCHMQALRLDFAKRQITFRINHKLEQFPRDYNPSIRSQRLVIGLNSEGDIKRVDTLLKKRSVT